MKRILSIACGLALTTSGLAQEHLRHHHHEHHYRASSKSVTGNSPVYIGGSFGMSDTHWDPAFDSTGLGFNVLGGYRFNSLWSAEASFTHFADATNSSNSISTNSLAAMAKITLPIGDTEFKFISKMGFAETLTSGFVSHNHLGAVFGVAAALPINPMSTLEAGYTHFNGRSGSDGVENADFYGITYVYFLPANLFN